MGGHRSWTRAEQLQVLRLYMRLPFGQLHQRHREIISLARRLDRTPGAVAMKATNFASLDETITRTGRRGLTGASSSDRALWVEFLADPEAIAAEAENEARAKAPVPSDLLVQPTNPSITEVVRLVRARRVQSFFRAAVLASYDFRCAVTGLAEPRLLNASHIIPWSVNVARRADPTNGVCLNALFDRAFDRGLITFDDNFQVVIAPRLRTISESARFSCSLLEAEGQPLALPSRFLPDLEAIRFHRATVFQSE